MANPNYGNSNYNSSNYSKSGHGGGPDKRPGNQPRQNSPYTGGASSQAGSQPRPASGYQAGAASPVQAGNQADSATIDGRKDFDPVEVGQTLVDQITADYKLKNNFTTSQLRKVMSAAVVVKNRIDRETGDSDALSPAIQEEIQYLRVKLIYQMGRDANVKTALKHKGVDLAAVIQNIGASRKSFDRFYRLLESIVAYRKYAGE